MNSLLLKLTSLFSSDTFRPLFLAGDDAAIDAALALHTNLFNLHAAHIDYTYDLAAACVRVVAVLLAHHDLASAVQHFFLRHRMDPNFSTAGLVPPVSDAVVCAAQFNNLEMVRFFLRHGAVVQHLPATNPSLLSLLVGDRHQVVRPETFQLLIETMPLTPTMPPSIREAANRRRPVLSAEKIRLLLQQGATFDGWGLAQCAADLPTFMWMLDEKFVDGREKTMIQLFEQYLAIRPIEPAVVEILGVIVDYLVSVPQEKHQGMVEGVLNLYETVQTATSLKIVRAVFEVVIKIERLQLMKVKGYPVLLFAAKMNYSELCYFLVKMGMNRRMFITHVFSGPENGATLATNPALKAWFAEPEPPVAVVPNPAVDQMVAIEYKKKESRMEEIDA